MADLCSGMSTDRSYVQQAKLFEGLDAASLDTILNLATPRSVPRGATLFKQGDEPCWLTLITEGRLKIGLVAPDGRTLAVGYLGPGEIAGCAAVFQRVPYPATAKAVEDSAVLFRKWRQTQSELWAHARTRCCAGSSSFQPRAWSSGSPGLCSA